MNACNKTDKICGAQSKSIVLEKKSRVRHTFFAAQYLYLYEARVQVVDF